MGVKQAIRGFFIKIYKSKIQEVFDVNEISAVEMQNAINKWINIYRGNPYWLKGTDDEPNDVKTINFAKIICDETARLTNLALDINVDGSRADYLKKFADKCVLPKLRAWTEYAAAYGIIILKPNGAGVDMITPENFVVTALDSNGNITGIVFQDNYVSGEYYYTRFEYHQLEQNDEGKMIYTIINKAYTSKSANEIGDEIDLKLTNWAGLEPISIIEKENDENIDQMLFGVLRMPAANNIVLNGYNGMAIFSEAVEELKDLDIAYSRNASEIDRSERIVLFDESLLTMPPAIKEDGTMVKRIKKIAKWVKNINGAQKDDYYQEINPVLNTEMRIKGINNALSMIGYKCGYSNGYFVFDQKTGMVTATQVEADDRRTIQLIKDVRDCLKVCLDGLFYAQSIIADLYNLAPAGDYEITYSFGDITYNYEEDKQTCWKYVQAGKYPLWLYYVRFEKMSEEEARALVEEVNDENEAKAASGLFGTE